MIEFVQMFTRPSTDVQWFHETWPPSHAEYVKTNYVDTGRYTGVRQESHDGLLLTITHTFADATIHQEWMADEYMKTMLAAREKHNTENGIVLLSY